MFFSTYVKILCLCIRGKAGSIFSIFNSFLLYCTWLFKGLNLLLFPGYFSFLSLTKGIQISIFRKKGKYKNDMLVFTRIVWRQNISRKHVCTWVYLLIFFFLSEWNIFYSLLFWLTRIFVHRRTCCTHIVPLSFQI